MSGGFMGEEPREMAQRDGGFLALVSYTDQRGLELSLHLDKSKAEEAVRGKSRLSAVRFGCVIPLASFCSGWPVT
jgi:hypothetical protein